MAGTSGRTRTDPFRAGSVGAPVAAVAATAAVGQRPEGRLEVVDPVACAPR